MRGLKLGIDLGSTYSTFSHVNKKRGGVLEALTYMQGGDASIPSVVALAPNGQYLYGTDAKKCIGNSAYKVYSAFKMMLTGENVQECSKRGYDTRNMDDVSRYTKNTPAGIAKRFLEEMLEVILDRTNCDRIEVLYVGVPEIWFTKVTTLDGARMVRDICKSIECVDSDNVHVISEPLAASAFVANSYKMVKEKPFDGDMLVVDYGGGTLDITWTKVKPKDDNPDKLELFAQERTGEGGHWEGSIGNAGISYMEGVISIALRNCPAITDFSTESMDFQRNVRTLENYLGGQKRTVDKLLQKVVYNKAMGKMVYSENQQWINLPVEFSYNGIPFEVSYKHLVEAYNKKIAPVLNKELDKIIQKMDNWNRYVSESQNTKLRRVNYDDPDQGNFIVASVGGFGKYCLVNKQLETIFSYSKDDLYEIIDPQDAERAVSYGAALLASGELEIRNKADFSIGLYLEDGENKYRCYAIKTGQDLEHGKMYPVYYPQTPGRDPEKPVIRLIKPFEYLLFGDDRNGVGDIKLKLTSEEQKLLLDGISQPNGKKVNIGFSVDSANVITIYGVGTTASIDNPLQTRKTELGNICRIGEMVGEEI